MFFLLKMQYLFLVKFLKPHTQNMEEERKIMLFLPLTDITVNIVICSDTYLLIIYTLPVFPLISIIYPYLNIYNL
jgi:hypothetical protein